MSRQCAAVYETHVASGSESGKYVVEMPESFLSSPKNSWAVQMFSTGPKDSYVRFRDVKFVDKMPEDVKAVLTVPVQ